MKPFRLNSYEKHIVNFDFLDRNFSAIKSTELENVTIQTSNCLTLSKFQILTLSLTLEAFTQQRILQKKVRCNYLEISVNKQKFLTLLDLYLASVFLGKVDKFIFSYERLVNKIDFFIPNQVINNLNFLTLNNTLIRLNQNI